MSSHWKINEPDVLWECVDGEMVLIDFRTGCYYSVVGIGADVVQLLAAGNSLSQVHHALARAFGLSTNDVAEPLDEFVGQLAQEGLLTAAPITAPADPPVYRPATEQFTPPTLDKFDDMANQLLLDPIHEIDDFGCPPRAAV